MPEILGILEALGAMAETVGYLRDRLMDNGFTREEACDMCGLVLCTVFKGAGERKADDE